MSVEVAMQREMDFRVKREKSKGTQCCSSAVIISQSMEVHPSAWTQTPIPTPNPLPNPNPYHSNQVINLNPMPVPYNVPTHAQAEPSRPILQHFGPPLNPIPVTRPSPSRTSRPTYPTHQKRKTPIHRQPKCLKVILPEDYNCNLCQVDCNSEINLRMHLKGQKHKSMLRIVRAKKAVGETSEANNKLYCQLCGIWCTDMHTFTLHLNGKNHYLKLRATENKMFVPDRANTVAET